MPIPREILTPTRTPSTTSSYVAPGLPINTRTGTGSGGPAPRDTPLFEPDWGSLISTDEQALEYLQSQDIDAYIDPNTKILTLGTPEEVAASQHPELMGAGSDQMEADKTAAELAATKAKLKKAKKAKKSPYPGVAMDNPYLSAADQLASLSAEPTTNRSRYNAEESEPVVTAAPPPQNEWMGLLSALLENKRKQEEVERRRRATYG